MSVRSTTTGTVNSVEVLTVGAPNLDYKKTSDTCTGKSSLRHRADLFGDSQLYPGGSGSSDWRRRASGLFGKCAWIHFSSGYRNRRTCLLRSHPAYRSLPGAEVTGRLLAMEARPQAPACVFPQPWRLMVQATCTSQTANIISFAW